MSLGRSLLGLPLLACVLLLAPSAEAKRPARQAPPRVSMLRSLLAVKGDDPWRTSLFVDPLRREAPALALDGAAPPGVPPPLAFTPINAGDDRFEETRRTDRLLLFRQPPTRPNLLSGMVLFAAVNVAAKNAPPPFRLLMDGPVYIGTIVFPEGGAGFGVGGHTR